jgi:capsid protein
MSLLQSILTGSWRLEREQVRTQVALARESRPAQIAMAREYSARAQYFAGARPGTSRPHPAPLSALEDYRNAAERIVMIRAARQLEEDGGFFDGILDDFETYVVGDSLTYMPNTGNPEADKVIREYLEWQFDQADYSERKDLTKIAQLAIREMKCAGECGQIPVDVGDSIKLHGVPGDCIGNPMVATNAGDYNFGGIVVNERSGRPVRFQIFKRHPKRATYELDQEVSADQFWHYCDPFRIQQYHGFSAFKNAIRDGFDIDQILEFTKLNIKWRASQLPTVHTENGKAKAGTFRFGYNLDPDANCPPEAGSGQIAAGKVDVAGVTTNYLTTGESVMEYPNDFPNTQLRVTIEEFRRQCCKGAKLPYEFVYAADNGGVVQRFWVNKAENTFEKDKHLIKRTILNPFKNRVIEKGIETGELDLRRFGDLDVSLERFRGSWQMGKAVSVDYGKENDTDIALIDAGLMSQRDKAASMNLDLDKINDEKDAQARTAAEFGLDIREVLPFYDKKFPNQASVKSSQEAPAAEPNARRMPEEMPEEMPEGMPRRMPVE